ncbi:MAG TPA: hypothetical protein VFC19_42650 [Candidatus Limnocylindrales bacterium]|nr:hypothetical protein [Candidatus Limnocylindrales bacterium]
MPTLLTKYQPSVHGFRFGNLFRNRVVGPLSTWGACNGMAQVSLDYFHAGLAAPDVDLVDYGLKPVSGLGAASWSANRIDLFVRREDDRVATKRSSGGRFSDWRDLSSGEISLAPAASSWGPDRIDVMVKGKDGKLWHHWYDKGWAGIGNACKRLPGYPEDLGGALASSPAVASPFASRVETYARWLDHSLWFRYYDGQWRRWECLGQPDGVDLISDPAAAAHAGWTTVLVRGSDNAVWQKERTSQGWQPWRSLGGDAKSAPAVASPYPGRLEVCFRGTDGKMYLNIFTEGRWLGWTSLGSPPPGLSTERPAAVSHEGFLDVYALANDHTVWHKRWSNGWQPWQSTEVTISTASRRLTDAIYSRQMGTTIAPLLHSIRFMPAEVPPVGTSGRYAQFMAYPNEALFRLACDDEMSKLARILGEGNPISVGLLRWEAVGHEVVVFGGDINPGGRSTLRVYDPNYPGCDDMTITIDPVRRSIDSASGETWRSLWVRDDIRPEIPPC